MDFASFFAARNQLVGRTVTVDGTVRFKLNCPPPSPNQSGCVAVGFLTDDGREPVRSDEPDERLRLIFTCCHPALAAEARVALTLRTMCGLGTGEIASAFVVSESAIVQRLTRARRKIAVAGIPYRVPTSSASGCVMCWR